MRFFLALFLVALSTTACISTTKSGGKRNALSEIGDTPSCDPMLPRASSCFQAKSGKLHNR